MWNCRRQLLALPVDIARRHSVHAARRSRYLRNGNVCDTMGTGIRGDRGGIVKTAIVTVRRFISWTRSHCTWRKRPGRGRRETEDRQHDAYTISK